MGIVTLAYANAYIIMNMHKIAHIMDVSTLCKCLCFILLSNKLDISFLFKLQSPRFWSHLD